MGVVVEFYAVTPEDLDARGSDPVVGDAEGKPPLDAHVSTADIAREQGLLLESVPINSLASRALWELLAGAGIDLGPDQGADHSGIVLDQPLIDRLLHATAPDGERPAPVDPVAEAIQRATREAVEEATWKGHRLVMVVS